jgi:hypothetical protein
MLPVRIAKQTQEVLNTGQGTANGNAAAITAEPWDAKYGVFIRNHDAADALFVGNSAVSAANGFRIDAAKDLWVPVDNAREIYAITGGNDVNYSFLVV